MPFFDRTKTGVLVSRMTSDIEALTDFVNEGAVMALTNLLTAVGVAVAMLIVDVQLALAVFVLIGVLIVLTAIFQHFASIAYSRVRERIGHVLATLQEGSPAYARCRHSPSTRSRPGPSEGSTRATSTPTAGGPRDRLVLPDGELPAHGRYCTGSAVRWPQGDRRHVELRLPGRVSHAAGVVLPADHQPGSGEQPPAGVARCPRQALRRAGYRARPAGPSRGVRPSAGHERVP